jgi:hypothetical protein
MKNVLFTTTAIAGLALSGAAFAAGHSSGNFGISGSTDVGYNDDIKGGIFQETNIDIKASKDAGNGYEIGGHVRLNLDWFEGATEVDSGVDEVEFKNIYVDTPIGKLEFADSFDGTGASDSYYADREGMDEDMTNGDGHAGIKWSGDVGDFGYAIDLGNTSANSATNTGDHYTVGLGGSFGDFKVGLGYENESHEGAGSVIGVSLDGEFGGFGVGLSHIDTDVDTSTGIELSGEFGGVDATVYYAINDAGGDQYGLLLDYANGPLGVGLDIHAGDDAADENVEIDVSYEVNSDVTVYAGYDDASEAGYAGAEIGVADGIKATISFAEADEIGGPEFKDGTSLFLTLTY